MPKLWLWPLILFVGWVPSENLAGSKWRVQLETLDSPRMGIKRRIWGAFHIGSLVYGVLPCGRKSTLSIYRMSDGRVFLTALVEGSHPTLKFLRRLTRPLECHILRRHPVYRQVGTSQFSCAYCSRAVMTNGKTLRPK